MAGDSFFIVLEGMDGAGKTGIARGLHATLSQTHAGKIALTYEPHDPSAAGLYARNALTKRIKVSPLSLALAFALNRADHLDHIIKPFLSAGSQPRLVICDRYVLSSLVYQSAGGLSMDDIYGLNHWALSPDLTIYLDVSPQNCYARLRKRPQDRELFERNLAERAEKYRAGIALLRGKGERVIEVDANPPFPEVLSSVFQVLREAGPAWLRIQQPLPLADDEADELAELDHADTLAELKAAQELTSQQLNQLFRFYLEAHGYEWGERLPWLELPAYDLIYRHRIGLEERGIALILPRQGQSDGATKVIHRLLDGDRNALGQHFGFIIALDKSGYEPIERFERDSSYAGRLSAGLRFVSRQNLLDWLESDDIF